MTNIWPDRFKLENKVVIVTGGAGLIGRHICTACAEAGGTVIVAEKNKEQGIKLSDEIVYSGYKAYYVDLDITSEKSIDDTINYVVKNYGRIDVWINNAYPRTADWGNKLEDIKFESFEKNVSMHMNSYFLCCQKVVEVMKKQNEGSIINFGSMYGVVGPTFSIYEGTNMTMPAAYSAIKGGIINFTRYLAAYVGKYNIRVNAICPGGIFDNKNPVFVEKFNNRAPLGRMGMPDEIAGPVLFLASDASSYITGNILMVDGGWTAC